MEWLVAVPTAGTWAADGTSTGPSSSPSSPAPSHRCHFVNGGCTSRFYQVPSADIQPRERRETCHPQQDHSRRHDCGDMCIVQVSPRLKMLSCAGDEAACGGREAGGCGAACGCACAADSVAGLIAGAGACTVLQCPPSIPAVAAVPIKCRQCTSDYESVALGSKCCLCAHRYL